MPGKRKQEMTPAQLEAERVRKRGVARELRERQKAEREAARAATGSPLIGAGDFPTLDASAAGHRPEEEVAVSPIPLSEYIDAGELVGMLTLTFRTGADPQALLSGAERDWLDQHPFGAAVVEERMILHGLGDAYEDWASGSPM